jgi:hypothetical protein
VEPPCLPKGDVLSISNLNRCGSEKELSVYWVRNFEEFFSRSLFTLSPIPKPSKLEVSSKFVKVIYS